MDCGAHIGESVELFSSSPLYDKNFKIYSFEASSRLSEHYWRTISKLRKNNPDLDVDFINKAVWICDGTVKMYLNFGNIRASSATGSTIKVEKAELHKKWIDLDHPVETECVDLSGWLRKNVSPNDMVILKMDIEGAEYDVLQKILDDGTISMVNKMFVEWHWNRIGMSRKHHSDFVTKLKSVKNLELHGEMFKYYRKHKLEESV